MRLAGHTLVGEGRPLLVSGCCGTDLTHGHRNPYDRIGHGRCSCGEFGPCETTNRARQMWHHDHKTGLREARLTAWPEACQSMTDLTGWGEVDCATRERFFGDYRDRLAVFSALTDPDGQYGPGVVYTEWGVKDGEKPWLRDYRWTDNGCVHYMPKANIAWPTSQETTPREAVPDAH